MPLPKPPAKRADMLTEEEIRSQPKAAKRPSKLKQAPSATLPATPAAPSAAVLELVKPARPAAEAVTPTARVTPPPVEARAPGAPRPATGAPSKARGQAPTPSTGRSRRKTMQDDGPPKLFVLDTNVLLHDPTSLFRFAEHDIYLPMITLEELDGHKKGMTEVARNARQVSRDLDALAADMGAGQPGQPDAGIPLAKTGHVEALGRLFFQTMGMAVSLPTGLPQGKADNQILGVVQALRDQHKGQREVVLVSKDINMRIKARALGLPAEDYFNDKALEDGDLLYTGVLPLPTDFWERHAKGMESWQQGGVTYYRLSGPMVPAFLVNQFVYLETPGASPWYGKVTEITGKTAVLRTLKDYTHQKHAVWGVAARNREQNFALNLLMDPECDFVTLTGSAGTGKTLMTLASALSQVLDERRYTEIIVTRVTVPVGEDIGFLPGTEEEKMSPWMGALDDNLEVLARSDNSAGEWGRAATQELVRSKIKIKSLNFMRGRTFLNKFVIIDEAQNLTPKQMKTLITRAGPGTKIVCLGNLAQIDTPYLTEGSSGLTYAVDRFKGWPHSGHVTLARGERSRLADYASDVL
ncbi:AAA family ATPase [Aquabacterium fontiphilum]|jgi:PhoH-like ATPase|uniref:PhoH family protein n=1 Tax=Aquabacterium fontiphilum TaxID=450365 RepID=UPI0013774DA3|nr:PhoH family protein [Aquabacterium fontiphilum]NBD21394.1 AAA family ATPase [Aquabacterium fontiphilum]